MGYKCCVDVCQSETSSLSIRLHSFPKNLTLCKKWVAALKKNCKFEPKKSRICSKHFEEKHLMSTSLGITKLKSGAIPSIFVNAQIGCNDIGNDDRTRMTTMPQECSSKRKHKFSKYSDDRTKQDNETSRKNIMLYNGYQIMYHDTVMRIQSLEKESRYLQLELESLQQKIDEIENNIENQDQ